MHFAREAAVSVCVYFCVIFKILFVLKRIVRTLVSLKKIKRIALCILSYARIKLLLCRNIVNLKIISLEINLHF